MAGFKRQTAPKPRVLGFKKNTSGLDPEDEAWTEAKGPVRAVKVGFRLEDETGPKPKPRNPALEVRLGPETPRSVSSTISD